MRYIYILLFLICPVLVNAKGHESYFITCLSTPFPYNKEAETMNMQRKNEQNVYWEKHKKLKRYAFSALGLGVCGTIVGWIGVFGNNAYTNSNWKNDRKAWNVVLGAGIGLTVSSIPLFIISHKNKEKAREKLEFSLKSSNIHSVLPNGMTQIQQAVGLNITF